MRDFNVADSELEAKIIQESDLAEHIAGLPTERIFIDVDTGEELIVPIDNRKYIRGTKFWSNPRKRRDGKWVTAVCDSSTAEGRKIERKKSDWAVRI